MLFRTVLAPFRDLVVELVDPLGNLQVARAHAKRSCCHVVVFQMELVKLILAFQFSQKSSQGFLQGLCVVFWFFLRSLFRSLLRLVSLWLRLLWCWLGRLVAIQLFFLFS